MADSRLTVRTLCLATVALVLACGHAARAMAQQQKSSIDRVPAKASSVIRVVPAGSGKSTIATFTAGSAAGSRSSGASRVATFTSKAGSSSGSTVATFSGDRVIQRTASVSRKQHAKPGRRTPSILREKKEPPVIAVRRPGTQVEQTPVSAPVLAVQPPPSVVKPARQGLRNAFGGLSSAPATDLAATARTYAHSAR